MSKLHSAFASSDAKRRYVRTLFATIADRYDFITAFLSYGQDARWKRVLVTRAAVRPGDRALDLASGTGDIAFGLASQGAQVIALDITHRMLQIARGKTLDARAASSLGGGGFVTGDMIAVPCRNAAFDLVTTGYGLRNVPDLELAIDEISRVLKPGGRLLSLDFNRPENAVIRSLYLWYLSAVGSLLGWALHRDPDTYRYIPESIRRYPGARGVAAMLASRGFERITVVPMLFGLMSLHIAHRSR